MQNSITKDDGELVVLHEDSTDTQKKLRTWLSTGYAIQILAQSVINNEHDVQVITTLIRKK